MQPKYTQDHNSFSSRATNAASKAGQGVTKTGEKPGSVGSTKVRDYTHTGVKIQPKQPAAVTKSKQNQVRTGNVVDAAAKAPRTPKAELFNKGKVHIQPTGAGRLSNLTRSKKI